MPPPKPRPRPGAGPTWGRGGHSPGDGGAGGGPPAAETEPRTRGRADMGAVVAFTGFCRDEGGRLAALELEHYPGMAEAEIARIAQEAERRRPLPRLTALPRVGTV